MYSCETCFGLLRLRYNDTQGYEQLASVVGSYVVCNEAVVMSCSTIYFENGTRFQSKSKKFLNITMSGTILILFIYTCNKFHQQLKKR